MKRFSPYIFLLLIPGLVFISSCKKKIKKHIGWESEMLLPLAHGNLTIGSLVGDTLLVTNPDNSVKLVYKNTIYDLNLVDQSIEIPDTSLKQVVRLDSIYLPDRTITYPITLGRIAKEDQSGVGAFIILLHGGVAPIPALNNMSSSNQEIDATSLFKSAELDAGFLDLEIFNGFPVDITDVIFQLKNKSDNTVIFIDTFPLIPKGSTVTASYDLSGKTIEGILLADILNLSSPGSGGNNVPIDTNDAMILKVTARDLDIHSATAIFPAQNLIDIKNEVTYNMNGPEFTFMKIKTGKLVITAVNTIEDSLHLNYKIPGAKSSAGQIINLFTSVPPAPPGGSINLAETIDLAGYTIDLTGLNKNKVNTFYNEFTARIDSTGKLISISLDDSVSIFYGLQDIVPEYVRGYLGQHQFAIGPEFTSFDLFKNIQSGTLDMKQVDVNFSLYNGIGAEGQVNMEYLKAINTKTGTSVTLNAPSVIGQNLSINRAFENPKIPGLSNIELTNGNSNIAALLSSFPDKLEYKLNMDINKDGNKFNYQDFLNYYEGLNVSLDMEMPLDFVANALVLQDTFDFKLNADPSKESGVKDGQLTLLVDNQFPLDAEVQLYFLNGNGQLIDSLFTTVGFVEAGEIETSTCQVVEKKRSKLIANVDETKISHLEQATKAVIKVKFNSQSPPSCSDFVKIYSNYGFEFKLLARFNYTFQEF